jgi:hypothetical protein
MRTGALQGKFPTRILLRFAMWSRPCGVFRPTGLIYVLPPSVTADPRRAAAILNASKWVNGTVLHYCFFGDGNFSVPQTQADAVRDVIKQWKAVGVRPQAFQGADVHRAASTVLSRAIRHEVADVFLDDLDDRDLLTPDPQPCRNRLRGCEAPKDCAAGGSSTARKGQ